MKPNLLAFSLTGSLLIGFATGASAQTADAAPVRTYGLTDAQKAGLLEENARVPDYGDPLGGGVGRQVHGEVGAMIGTGGARGLYGTAAVPIGENGGASFSFESSRYGYGRRRP